MAGKHSGDHSQTPENVVHDHHGQSVASWTTVGLLLVAAALIALAFPLADARMPLLAIGIGLTIVGLVVGKVLSSTGYGVRGKGEVTNIVDAPEVANGDEVGIS
ncbi:HGxxPAAW family protein [Nostocoides sp. F2B08]|uniref:HGxxPAAW family protein n=1 Tax=Nostocoides sp. F2B08 TaxID=2653936 RepID=UPI00186AC52E|nr:HGxxPAAW family protein [Tetrasphaera sp. F2B08]